MRMQLKALHISIILTLLAIHTNAQEADTTRIQLEDIEVNFLTSYYEQDGNNSPVTGGRGTEVLTNLAPSINIKIPIDSSRTIVLDGGVDFYSSASSDNINNPFLDPNHVSGASSKDERSYFTFSYKKKVKKMEYGLYFGSSFEWDVFSYSAGGSIAISSKDKNRSLDFSSKYYFDDWKLIYPVEFRIGTQEYLSTDKRHSINNSLLISANLTTKISASISSDFVIQNGLLSTPFHRAYFQGQEDAEIENLPSSRMKYPIGLRVNGHVTDFLIVKTFFRHYQDDWGLTGQTMELTLPIKINQALRVYPFYRFHSQQGVDYFKPYKEHVVGDEFFTSDYDLGTFDSHKFGAGISYSPLFGLMRFKYAKEKAALLKAVNIRYAYYDRSDGLNAGIVTVGLQLNFKRGYKKVKS